MVDISGNINESWYDGHVHILFKDSAFEPSSPCQHAAELNVILQPNAMDYPLLFLYTDGGPDHHLTYASVKLTLIALFQKLDLDYLGLLHIIRIVILPKGLCQLLTLDCNQLVLQGDS